VSLPPKGRLSLLHGADLARLLLALAQPDAPKQLVIEPDDSRPGGWTHKEFATALGKAVGRRPVSLSVPGPIVRLGAQADRLLRRGKAKLTPDRAAYFCHPDWVADPACGAPAELWRPEIDSEQGFAETARWYREKGWL
jgi:nucleoside-diphosphate-sugar epimerase